MQFVKVPLSELVKATAAPKMKRMPKGVKGHIEKHTILEFHPNFMVVDAPTQSQVLQVKCGFRETFKVGSQHLYVTLQKLPKAEFAELGLDTKTKNLVIRCAGLEIKLVGEQ